MLSLGQGLRHTQLVAISQGAPGLVSLQLQTGGLAADGDEYFSCFAELFCSLLWRHDMLQHGCDAAHLLLELQLLHRLVLRMQPVVPLLLLEADTLSAMQKAAIRAIPGTPAAAEPVAHDLSFPALLQAMADARQLLEQHRCGHACKWELGCMQTPPCQGLPAFVTVTALLKAAAS